MLPGMAPVVLDPHAEVRGVEVAQAEVRDGGAWVPARWADLDGNAREPGDVQVRVHVDGGTGGADVQVPPCAGRKGVTLDGQKITDDKARVTVRDGQILKAGKLVVVKLATH